MKQLQCEICGGTDIIKENGVFVCKTCGCKYSVDEIRKIMFDGAVEVTGTVKVDNSSQKQEKINNYYKMAQASLDSRDVDGVITYCDKILELDSENYQAWVMKAKVAGWGSSLANIKIPHAISAAKRAVLLSPDEKKGPVAAEIYTNIKTQLNSLLSNARNLDPSTQLDAIRIVENHWMDTLDGIPSLSTKIVSDEKYDIAQKCFAMGDITYANNFCNSILRANGFYYKAYILKVKIECLLTDKDNQNIPAAIENAKKAISAAPTDMKSKVALETFTVIKDRVDKLLYEGKNAGLLAGNLACRAAMDQWLAALKGIPYLSKQKVADEIKDCEKRLEESRCAFMPSNRILYAACGKYDEKFIKELAGKF